MDRQIIFCSFLAFCIAAPGVALSQTTGTPAGTGATEQGKTEEKIEEIQEVEVVGPENPYYSRNYAVVERGINVMTPRTLHKNSLLFLIDHRTRSPLKDHAFHDFLGFDAGGLKIGLGLRYGLLDNLEAGMYRTNGVVELFDVYEFDLKYRLLDERKEPLNLAFRGGVTWFSQSQGQDASGVFAQLLAGRTFRDKVSLTTGLLYHTDSSNDLKSVVDDDFSLAIPAQFEFRFRPGLAWDFEVVTAAAGYRSAHPDISTSIKIITHGHSFSLVVSNTQYISADGIVSNSGRGLKKSLIGFTITREFNL